MSRRFTDKHLLIATHNRGKLEEMEQLFKPYGLELSSNADHQLPEPEETETTFVGNARIKAHAACKATGLPALSDDSGITIDGIDGAPGVYTADWAETPNGRDFKMAMERSWRELLAWPDGHDEVVEGVMPGQITWPMRGTLGHGYDPIFQPDGYSITFGEMDRFEKNKISHRGRAFEKLIAACFA